MPTLSARGVELSWIERGTGAPVLLIHETATGRAVWEPLAGAIAERGRAIAYDRRGWGRSSAPEGYRRTTIEEQSEDAAALIEAAGAAPTTACGAGIGAVIALDLLLRRPELIAGAVLIEPPLLSLLPEATEALSADRTAIAEAVPDRGLAAAVELYLSGSLTALAPGVERLPAELTAPARERPLSLFAEIAAPSAWGMPLPRLARAERPSLLVTSAVTPPLIAAASAALEARLAGAERAEVEASAPPHLGAPAAVAELSLGLAPP